MAAQEIRDQFMSQPNPFARAAGVGSGKEFAEGNQAVPDTHGQGLAIPVLEPSAATRTCSGICAPTGAAASTLATSSTGACGAAATAAETAFSNTGARSRAGVSCAPAKWPARCRPLSMRARSHSSSLNESDLVPRDRILHKGLYQLCDTYGVPVRQVDL